MRKLIMLFFSVILSYNLMAQLEVKEGSFKEVEGFVNINTDIMFDDNDKPYAVLKVKTENINDKDRHQLLFQGDARTFFEVEYKVGEVWLYISYYATYIKISHPDFGSTEFWFPFDMQGKKGYELTLVNKPPLEEVFLKRLEALENATATGLNTGEYGYVVIKTTPVNNATVLIDGDEMETKTPYVSDKLSVGPHRIRVIKEHYKPYVTVVDVESGKTNYLDVELTPAMGSLEILTNPKNASITINREHKGSSPKVFDLQAGIYKVELNKNRYETVVKEVEVKDGETSLLEIDMPTLKSLRRKQWVFRPEIGCGIIQEDRYEYANKSFSGGCFVINVNAGYHFNSYIYLGGGLGANIVKYEKILGSLPLYINPRFYLNDRQNSLYIDFRIGYAVTLKKDTYNYVAYYEYSSEEKFSGICCAFEIGMETKYLCYGLSIGSQQFQHDDYNGNPICFMLKFGYNIFLNKK